MFSHAFPPTKTILLLASFPIDLTSAPCSCWLFSVTASSPIGPQNLLPGFSPLCLLNPSLPYSQSCLQTRTYADLNAAVISNDMLMYVVVYYVSIQKVRVFHVARHT